ncbi:hypothetical protein V6N13_086898 [Hibiscus sabdariffa]|uniref:Uncharacterized protein n=1 Tax=Hibiscus sabdariffa TaxID=183260 RepID=A0ABR2FUL6_9ROSI
MEKYLLWSMIVAKVQSDTDIDCMPLNPLENLPETLIDIVVSEPKLQLESINNPKKRKSKSFRASQISNLEAPTDFLSYNLFMMHLYRCLRHNSNCFKLMLHR